MKNKKGFTLIEVLVVVLIIGILAAIAVPKYQVAVAKSRLATLKDAVSSLKNAQEVFYLANGKYSENVDELDITMPGQLGIDEYGWLIYPWGKCSVGLQSVACFITGFFSYQRYYDNTDTGRIVCLAVFDNEPANQVCKRETGKNTPRYKELNSAGYKWNTYDNQ